MSQPNAPVVRCCRYVLHQFATGATAASAAILALGLVAVPPAVDIARTEVRAVQLAAFAPVPAVFLSVPEKFVSTQSLPGEAEDTTTAVTETQAERRTTALTLDPADGPASDALEVQATALAAPIAAIRIAGVVDWVRGVVTPIVGLLTNPGVLLLFGPLLVLVVLACPPCAVVNVVTGLIGSFVSEVIFAPAAQADEAMTPALVSDSAPAETGTAHVSASATSTDNPPDSERATSTEVGTATNHVTQSTTTDEAFTPPAAEPAKPAVRASAGGSKRSHDLLDRGDADPAAATGQRGAEGRISSGRTSRRSSLTGSQSSHGNSSNGENGHY